MGTQGTSDTLPEAKRYELQQLARKDITTLIVVGFLLPPVGYVMVDRNVLALICLLTFGYLLFGFIIVPWHTRKMVLDARKELKRHGHDW